MTNRVGEALKAVKKNNLATVIECVTQDRNAKWFESGYTVSQASVNSIDGDGNTLLMLAAERGYREIVQYLLSRGADPHLKNKTGENALMLAAAGGHRAIMGDLLDAGVKIDDTNHLGDNAIMYAGARQQAQALTFLLDYNDQKNGKDNTKALINAANNNGWTALMFAAGKARDLLSATILLERGANPDKQNDGGWTALMILANHSADYDKLNQSVAKLLLDYRARTDLKNNDGKTVTEIAYGSLHRFIAGYARPAVGDPAAPATVDVDKQLSLLEDRRAALEKMELDPSQSEHWILIGNVAAEHIVASVHSPKMLSTVFNFAANQYVSTCKNLVTGETESTVEGKLEEFPNPQLVVQAKKKLNPVPSL